MGFQTILILHCSFSTKIPSGHFPMSAHFPIEFPLNESIPPPSNPSPLEDCPIISKSLYARWKNWRRHKVDGTKAAERRKEADWKEEEEAVQSIHLIFLHSITLFRSSDWPRFKCNMKPTIEKIFSSFEHFIFNSATFPPSPSFQYLPFFGLTNSNCKKIGETQKTQWAQHYSFLAYHHCTALFSTNKPQFTNK